MVSIRWMCKKQTSVSHSSTESQIISLDADLRMDGPLAHDLWDVVIKVLRSSGNRSREHKSKPKQKGNRDVDQLSHVVYVTTNANSSQGESQLYIFEDNEAVIKMIIKGRSPTMRHVSRTQRVAVDRSFDRINLDPKIQIKYVDTKNQLADMLTEGSFVHRSPSQAPHLVDQLSHSFVSVVLPCFPVGSHVVTLLDCCLCALLSVLSFVTASWVKVKESIISLSIRDEWDHLLRFLNIMNSSMFSCSHFLSNRKQSVMSKRIQESTSNESSAVVSVSGVKEPTECEEKCSARFE